MKIENGNTVNQYCTKCDCSSDAGKSVHMFAHTELNDDRDTSDWVAIEFFVCSDCVPKFFHVKED